MTRADLRHFLLEKMSMTEIYQPVIIRELLKNGGSCSKDHLASKLAEYDLAVLQYYRQILMRWSKKTLEQHGIVSCDRKTKLYVLQCDLSGDDVESTVLLCEKKIAEWISNKRDNEKSPVANESIRYRILREAEATIDHPLAEVAAFKSDAPQSDDMTCVVLRVEGCCASLSRLLKASAP